MIKILILAIILGIILFVIKNVNYEFFIVSSVLAGIILSIYILKLISEEIIFIKNLINFNSQSNEIIKIIIKIVGIGYLTDFSTQTLNDFGLQSLSSKVVLGGKVIILYVSLPIFATLLNTISMLCT